MKKRIISMLLVCLMIVSLFPMGALAETPAAALPDAVNGVITLENDVNLTATVEITTNTTIDLAGHTITATVGQDNPAIRVTEATLTYKDSVGNGKLTSNNYGLMAQDSGTVIVESGVVESHFAALTGNNVAGDMNFTVNGGTLTSEVSEAIYMPGQQDLTITDGTINGGISARMGQITVTGGTINGMTDSQNADSMSDYYGWNGSAWIGDAIYVWGGTYTSDNATYKNTCNVTISGGTINGNAHNAVALYDIAKGYDQTVNITISGGTVNGVVVKDETYHQPNGFTVNGTISISGGAFTDLANAVKYAANNATIKLADNVNTTSSVVVPAGKKLTLDLNGKTLTSDTNDSKIRAITNNGELTIQGNGKIVSKKAATVIVGDNSKTTITNGTFESVEGAVVTGTATGAEIVINGGTFSASDNAVIAGNGSDRDGTANTITINGGTFNGSISTPGYIACGIYAPWDDEITVNGGTFTVNGGIGVVARAGKTTISGGTFNVTGTGKGWVGDKKAELQAGQVICFDKSNPNYPAYSDDDFVSISGGTFSDASAAEYLTADANIVIDGGNKEISDGITLTGNDTQSVKVKNFDFTTKGLDITGFQNVTVQNNTFTDITVPNSLSNSTYDLEDAILVNGCDSVVISGNTINSANEVGINCWNVKTSVQITGNNTVQNTKHNSVQVAGNTRPTATITGNTFENWGLGTAEDAVKDEKSGRALRAQVASLTFTGNKMINTNAPEQFVKISDTTGEVKVSENYWGGNDPVKDSVYLNCKSATDSTSVYADEAAKKAAIVSYYSDPAMGEGNLVTYPTPVAQITKESVTTKYDTLAAALAAAKTGENKVITILPGTIKILPTETLTLASAGITLQGVRGEDGEYLSKIIRDEIPSGNNMFIYVDAANITLEDLYIEYATTDDAWNQRNRPILTSAAADNFAMKNCYLKGPDKANMLLNPGDGADNGLIEGNTFEGGSSGIYIRPCNGTVINNNTFINNGKCITFEPGDTTIFQNVKVTGNTFNITRSGGLGGTPSRGNTQDYASTIGIKVFLQDGNLGWSDTNEISGNTFVKNDVEDTYAAYAVIPRSGVVDGYTQAAIDAVSNTFSNNVLPAGALVAYKEVGTNKADTLFRSLYAASVNNDQYLTLAEAINAANANQTVKLLSDVELTEQLTIDKAITLDGDNHTITSNAAGNGAILVKKVAATIQNLTVIGPNTTESGWDEGEYGIKLFKANNATLTDVTVTGANAGIQVNGGNVSGNKVTFNGTITVSGNEFGGIEVCNKGELDISNATLVNANETDANPVLWNDGGESADNKGAITFSNSQPLSKVEASAFKDHYYLPAQAKVGTVRFATLAEAITAAQAGDTVTLLADVTTNAKIVVEKSITIDLGDKTLTRSNPSIANPDADNGCAFEVNANGAVVTVTNGTVDCTGVSAVTNHQGEPYNKEVDAFVARVGEFILSDLTVKVNSESGACAYAKDGAKVTILSGEYSNAYTPVEVDTGMVLNQANVETQLIFVSCGTFTGKNPATGDDSGKVKSFLAPGYVANPVDGGWEVVAGADNVAEVIGVGQYTSLKDAIAAAKAGDTVKLLKDITFTDSDVKGDANYRYIYAISGSNDITIDGNGRKITAKLTSAKVGKAEGVYVFQITSTGATNFENLTIICDPENEGTVKGGLNYAVDSGTVKESTVTNCTIKTSDQDHNAKNWNVAAVVVNHAPVTIIGGTYIGGKHESGNVADYQGINVTYQNSTLKFVSGETNGIKVENSGNIEVEGGKHSAIIVESGTASITGGTFTVEPDAKYLATGYTLSVNNSGNYTVCKNQITVDKGATITVGDGVNKSPEAIKTELTTNTAVTKVDTGLDKVVTNTAVKTEKISTGIQSTQAYSDLTEEQKSTVNQMVSNKEFTTSVEITPKKAEKADTENEDAGIKLTFDVTPMVAVTVDNQTVETELEPSMVGRDDATTFVQPITFRLPLTSEFALFQFVEVTHKWEDADGVALSETLYANVKSEEITVDGTLVTNYYVELSFNHFSEVEIKGANDAPVAKIDGTEYKLLDFQSAVDYAREYDKVIDIILDMNYVAYETEDTETQQMVTHFITLGADGIQIRRNGHTFYVERDQESTDYQYDFVFVGEETAQTVVAEVKNTPTVGFFRENDPINVDVTLPNVTDYAGAYVRVRINTDYVSVAESIGWTPVTDSSTDYEIYDDTGSILENGILGKFVLTATNSTGAESQDIVSIIAAQYVATNDEAFTGVGKIAIPTENMTHASAMIRGVFQWKQGDNTLDIGADPSFENATYTYNGQGWTAPDGYKVYAVDGDTEIVPAVKYFTAPNNDDETGSSTSPINAGTHYVQYTVKADGYEDLISAKIPFVIDPKLVTVTYTVQDAKYDGRSHNFVTGTPTVVGLVEGDIVEVSFEDGSGIEEATYYVKAQINGNANYILDTISQVDHPAEITKPDYVVVKAEDYMSGYTMVYVFVENDARVTYDGKKLYEITKLGYDFTLKQGKSETDTDPYTVCRPATLQHDGYKVYAILVPGTATADVVLKPYNQGLAGTLSKMNDKNDINASKKVDLADAVAIATEYNNVGAISSKLSLYMATILRSDVDGNGVVDATDATGIIAKVREIPSNTTGGSEG